MDSVKFYRGLAKGDLKALNFGVVENNPEGVRDALEMIGLSAPGNTSGQLVAQLNELSIREPVSYQKVMDKVGITNYSGTATAKIFQKFVTAQKKGR